MITFALFDRLIILPVVVSIEFYKQKYIICIKKWKLARVLRDSSDSFDAAVKSKFWFAKQQRNPRALTMQGEPLPHLVRKNDLLGQQKRIQPLILAIELKIL